MSEPLIAEEGELPAADLAQIYAGLSATDPRALPARDFRPLVLTMRDERGLLRGGLLGETIWSWLSVGVIWVAPEWRGAGHGARLLQTAEDLAVARGCTHSRLDTFDWQARGFYEGRGYKVYAQLQGFPAGHTQFQLRKALAADPRGAS